MYSCHNYVICAASYIWIPSLVKMSLMMCACPFTPVSFCSFGRLPRVFGYIQYQRKGTHKPRVQPFFCERLNYIIYTQEPFATPHIDSVLQNYQEKSLGQAGCLDSLPGSAPKQDYVSRLKELEEQLTELLHRSKVHDQRAGVAVERERGWEGRENPNGLLFGQICGYVCSGL